MQIRVLLCVDFVVVLSGRSCACPFPILCFEIVDLLPMDRWCRFGVRSVQYWWIDPFSLVAVADRSLSPSIADSTRWRSPTEQMRADIVWGMPRVSPAA
jgi:hypothetical protein